MPSAHSIGRHEPGYGAMLRLLDVDEEEVQIVAFEGRGTVCLSHARADVRQHRLGRPQARELAVILMFWARHGRLPREAEITARLETLAQQTPPSP